jgi:hypothetical protein
MSAGSGGTSVLPILRLLSVLSHGDLKPSDEPFDLLGTL